MSELDPHIADVTDKPPILSRLGLNRSATALLFGTWKVLQEGVYYYIGGRIGGSLGTRQASQIS